MKQVIAFFATATVALLLTSCRTVGNVATTATAKADTVYISKTERVESILRDSVTIREKNDTVFIRVVKMRYKDILRIDTVYQSHTDTVTVTKTVTVTEKADNWKHILIEAALGLLAALLLFLHFKR